MDTSNLRRSVKVRVLAAAVAAMAGFGWASNANAAVFLGNGATGFGGPVGLGSLSVTDDGAGNVTFAFTTSPTHASGLDGNNLVIYLSTGATGLADTRTLIDTGNPPGSDFGHVAISGYNDFKPNGQPVSPTNMSSRTVVAFPSGFQATYAFSFANAFDGLFSLPTDGSGLLGYVTGAAPVNADNTLTIPLSDIGLTPGQSFSLVATDIDGSAAYRSNEAIGNAVLNPDPTTGDPGTDLALGGNPGFNNLIQFTSSNTYTTSVPEPAAFGLVLVAGALAVRRRRGRTAN